MKDEGLKKILEELKRTIDSLTEEARRELQDYLARKPNRAYEDARSLSGTAAYTRVVRESPDPPSP